MVGAEAAVVAADRLDTGQMWGPRRRSPDLHSTAQASATGLAKRGDSEDAGLFLQFCVSHCRGHLQGSQYVSLDPMSPL